MSMEDLNKVSYFKNFRVNSYESDRSLNLKINCLFQWFSEIAWEHAKRLNLGFEDLGETDYYWVLLGMRVEIKKLPKWQDDVKLQTWPSGISGLYFSREFILFDSDNEILASASSSWLIYNRTTLRPVVPKGNEYGYNTNSQKAVNEQFSKLRPHNCLIPEFSVVAQYADIDMHQHVNNAVYIKWMENYFGDLHPQKITNIKIQYLKEVKLGEEVFISFCKENNIYYCEASVSNEKTCFRAEIEII